METLDLFKRKLWYNYWANLRAVDSLRSLSPPSRKATSALMDVLITEKLWLARLLGEDTGKVPSDLFRKVPEIGFAGMVEESFRNYDAYLSALDESTLDAMCEIQSDSGSYEASTRDVLTHILNQSIYHRGQLAMTVRDEGGEPVPSDYTLFVREMANLDSGSTEH